MTEYTVQASREGRFWLLTIDGVGTTQAKSLREAPEMARSLISVMRGIRESAINVTVIPQLPTRYQKEVEQAQFAVERLNQQQAETAHRTRLAAHNLVHSLGLSGRDAAVVLGVSPQRVSQLIAE